MLQSGSVLHASKAALAAIALGALAAAAAADVLVVGSTGRAAGRYPVGLRLPDNEPIHLRQNDSVTLLGPGGTRVFRGPGGFRPSDPVRRGGPVITQASPNRLGGISMSSLERGRDSSGAVLVIRASGPSARSYPPGRRLDSSARIVLRPGDSIVLFSKGTTRTLRGPGTFAATGPVRAGIGLAAVSGNRRARTGALRNRETAPGRPGLWHVNVTRGGTVCILDPQRAVLWRPDATETVKLRVEPSNGAPQEVKWSSGEITLAWPDTVPLLEGVAYRLSTGDPETSSQIQFAFLDAATDLETVASQLIEKGCDEQLDVLIEATSKETLEPTAAPVEAEFVAPSLQDVDLRRGGRFCVFDPAAVQLWRPEPDERITVRIETEEGDPHLLGWPAGAQLLAWPSELPIRQGAAYRLHFPEEGQTTEIEFQELSGEGGDLSGTGLVDIAGRLLERGCIAQLERIVEKTDLSSAAEPGR